MSPRRSCSPRSDAGSPVAPTSARIFPRATTRSSWRTPWPIAGRTAVPGSTICRSRSPAGRRRSASTEDRDDGTGCHADGDALPTGAGVRAHLRNLRGPLSEGLGDPRRPQLHRGHAGRLPLVQVVLPDGCLRQLRDEGERLAEAHVRVVSVGLLARPDPRGAAGLLPGRARPGRGHERLHAQAQEGEALDHPTRRAAARGGRVPPDARPARRLQAVQHVHQLHALLLGVSHLWARTQLHRSGGHRPGPTLQHGLAGRGCAGAARDPLRALRHLAVHLCRGVHEGVPQARRSRRRHPTVQAHGSHPLAQIAPPPPGRAMSAEAHYTPYHPRWYRRRVSVWWWLQNRAYAGFVLRELTSVFVAFFAGVTLWQLRTLAQGPDAYARFLACLGTPLFVALHAVAFLFVLDRKSTRLNSSHGYISYAVF